MIKNFKRSLENLFPPIRKNKKLLEEFSSLSLLKKTKKLYSLFEYYTKLNKQKYLELKFDIENFVENSYFSEELKYSLLNNILRKVLENTKTDDIKNLIIDYHYNEMDRQLEKFKKLDLSKKLEKLFPKGHHELDLFIEHPDISEELKHQGLYDIMREFLDPLGGIPDCQLFHWMMYRLGLEEIYKKEFAKYYFSSSDYDDLDDFLQDACAYGAVFADGSSLAVFPGAGRFKIAS